MSRYRLNQHFIVLKLDSVSINKILVTGFFFKSFTKSKFDVKYVNIVKSTT